jgi:hypothetical protein
MRTIISTFQTAALLAICLLLAASNIQAQKIPFQGQLLENDAPVNGNKTFIFNIADISWTETHSNVAVSNGLYAVVLGSITPLPANLFSSTDSRLLGITVNGQALGSVNIYASMSLPNTNASITVDAAPDGKDFATYSLSGTGTANKLYRSIVGTSAAENGLNTGVTGLGISSASTTNTTYGVFGRASGSSLASQHRGVYGEAISPAGSTSAQYGLFGSASGPGTGSHFGLLATSQGAPTGREFNFGGLSTAEGAGKNNIGMRGFAFGPGNGATGFGTGSYNNGVQGFARSNTWGNTGVYGWVYNDPDLGGIGVDNNGVVGRSEVNNGTTTISNQGVYGEAKGSGINRGIVGNAFGGVENWAGWFEGDVRIKGKLVADGDLVAALPLPDSIVKSYENIEKNSADVFYTEAKGAGEGGKIFSALTGRSETTNGQNWGVFGMATKGNGASTGVRGFVNVENNPNPNFSAGVFGSMSGPVPAPQFTVGTYAQNVASGNGEAWGLGAFSTSSEGVVRAIRARASSAPTASSAITEKEVYGAWIQANGDGTGNHYGGWFNAMGKGVNYGIRATASAGTENWAGWFDGNVKITGSLSVDGGGGRIAASTVNSAAANLGEKHWEPGLQGYMDLRGDAPDGKDNIRAGMSVETIDGESFGSFNLWGPVYDNNDCPQCPRAFVYAKSEKKNDQVSGRFEIAGPQSPNFSFQGAADSNMPVLNLIGNQTHTDGWHYNHLSLSVEKNGNNEQSGSLKLGGNNGKTNISMGGKQWEGNNGVNRPYLGMTGNQPNVNMVWMDAQQWDNKEWGNISFNSTDGKSSRFGAYDAVLGDPFNGNGVYLNNNGHIGGNFVFLKENLRIGDNFHNGGGGVWINKAEWTGPNQTETVGEVMVRSSFGAEMSMNPYGLSLNNESNQQVVQVVYMATEAESGRLDLRSNTDGGIRMYGNFEGRGKAHIALDGANGNYVHIYGDGQINMTGDINMTGVVNSTSDRTLKTNIQPLSNTLGNVNKLRGVAYQWADQSKSQRRQIGVIAQEVEEVYPEFVHTDEQGLKSVNYSQMVAVLIESVKELNAEIKALKAENNGLKTELSKVSSNEQRIADLESSLKKLISLMQPSTAEAGASIAGNEE